MGINFALPGKHHKEILFKFIQSNKQCQHTHLCEDLLTDTYQSSQIDTHLR